MPIFKSASQINESVELNEDTTYGVGDIGSMLFESAYNDHILFNSMLMIEHSGLSAIREADGEEAPAKQKGEIRKAAEEAGKAILNVLETIGKKILGLFTGAIEAIQNVISNMKSKFMGDLQKITKTDIDFHVKITDVKFNEDKINSLMNAFDKEVNIGNLKASAFNAKEGGYAGKADEYITKTFGMYGFTTAHGNMPTKQDIIDACVEKSKEKVDIHMNTQKIKSVSNSLHIQEKELARLRTVRAKFSAQLLKLKATVKKAIKKTNPIDSANDKDFIPEMKALINSYSKVSTIVAGAAISVTHAKIKHYQTIMRAVIRYAMAGAGKSAAEAPGNARKKAGQKRKGSQGEYDWDNYGNDLNYGKDQYADNTKEDLATFNQDLYESADMLMFESFLLESAAEIENEYREPENYPAIDHNDGSDAAEAEACEDVDTVVNISVDGGDDTDINVDVDDE